MFCVMIGLLLGFRYMWSKVIIFFKGFFYVFGRKYFIKGFRMFLGINIGV